MKIKKMDFRYFNNQQNLYMEADIEIPKFDNVIDLSEKSHLHYGINKEGIVNFGLWHDDPNKRPGHGGFWSSREGVVGPLIGHELVSIGLNGYGTSMIKEKLEEILPAGYFIESYLSGNETVHKIQSNIHQNDTTATQVYAGYQKG